MIDDNRMFTVLTVKLSEAVTGVERLVSVPCLATDVGYDTADAYKRVARDFPGYSIIESWVFEGSKKVPMPRCDPAPPIAPGDVVMLKSGGPRMTVEQIDSEWGVLVSWFAGDDVNRKRFPAPCLAIADAVSDTKKTS